MPELLATEPDLFDPGSSNVNETLYVCDQLPGEAIYVPNGWYHTTLNIEQSMMVTLACGHGGSGASAWMKGGGTAAARQLVQRAQSFTVFPLRLPHAGFSEGLPWPRAVYWEQDTAVEQAAELLDMVQSPGLNRYDQMLSAMAAAGLLGQAAAAVIGARSALLSPATAPEAASLGVTRRSLPFLDWGGARQGLLEDATYPPYSSPATWVSHSPDLISASGGFSEGAVRAACGAGAAKPTGGKRQCTGLRGGGLASARFQTVPHQTAAHQRYVGEAIGISDEQEATILTSTLEVGLVSAHSRRVAEEWTSAILRRRRASVGVLRFAAALYGVITRPADAETGAIVSAVKEETGDDLRDAAAQLVATSRSTVLREERPTKTQQQQHEEEEEEVVVTAPELLLLEQLRPLVRAGSVMSLIAASRNPQSADAHHLLAQGLAMLGEGEAAVVAAVRAMALNRREIDSCVRLAKVFARAALDHVVEHGSGDRRLSKKKKKKKQQQQSHTRTGPPPLLVRVLTGPLGGVYDSLVTDSWSSSRLARLPDMLREAAGTRGQLSEFGPLTTFGPWGDLAVSRRVLAECSIRAGEVLAEARSTDQTTDASGQLYEIAVLARAFGVQRAVDVFRIVPQSAKSKSVPLDDPGWSAAIPPLRNHTGPQPSVAAAIAELYGIDLGLFQPDTRRSRSQASARRVLQQRQPTEEEDEADSGDDEWAELDWDGGMTLD